MRSEILGAASVGLCALVACNGSGTSAVADGAADSSTAGMCSADVPSGQACNALVLGAGVMPTCTTGTMATGQGGTIVDGTYVMTATTYYNDPTCPTFPVMETIQIAGGCLQLAVGSALFAATLSGTFTVAGSNITTTGTCFHLDSDATTVGRTASTQTFTATGTTFTLFTERAASGDPSSSFGVFTKQ